MNEEQNNQSNNNSDSLFDFNNNNNNFDRSTFNTNVNNSNNLNNSNKNIYNFNNNISSFNNPSNNFSNNLNNLNNNSNNNNFNDNLNNYNSINSKNKRNGILKLLKSVCVIGIFILIITFFFNKVIYNSNGSNKIDRILRNNGININNNIDNYNVDLKEFKLITNDLELYNNEIKGNIIQVLDFSIYINNIEYNLLFLTKNGNLYLYSYIGKILKINDNVNLSYISSVLPQNYSYLNSKTEDPLYFCGNGYIYKLNLDGTITEVDNTSNFIYLISANDTEIIGMTSDKKITLLKKCESKYDNDCSNQDYKLLKSEEKYKYADSKFIINENDVLFFSNIFLDLIEYDYNNLKIITKDYIFKNSKHKNIKNVFSPEGDSNSYFFQLSNNDIVLNFDNFDYNLELNYNIKYIYGNGLMEYLFSANDNVYMLEIKRNNNSFSPTIKEIKSLNNYKDKIKSLGCLGSTRFILLTNGNIYEIDFKELN